MKQSEILSYVYDFVSHLFESPVNKVITRIILFGSAARGNMMEESDVDLFVDAPLSKVADVEKAVVREINKFEMHAEKTWHVRGINSPLKVIVGDLHDKRWSSLRDEILSYGRLLYGTYTEMPDAPRHHVIVSYQLHKLAQKNKMALLRELFGYTSKKKKIYKKQGMLESTGGSRVGINAVIVTADRIAAFKAFFKKYKAPVTFTECWLK